MNIEEDIAKFQSELEKAQSVHSVKSMDYRRHLEQLVQQICSLDYRVKGLKRLQDWINKGGSMQASDDPYLLDEEPSIDVDRETLFGLSQGNNTLGVERLKETKQVVFHLKAFGYVYHHIVADNDMMDFCNDVNYATGQDAWSAETDKGIDAISSVNSLLGSENGILKVAYCSLSPLRLNTKPIPVLSQRKALKENT